VKRPTDLDEYRATRAFNKATGLKLRYTVGEEPAPPKRKPKGRRTKGP
jgi:hypothetical protein